MSRSVFDIWKEVFQKRRVKHEVKSMNSRVPGNMDFLYSLISDRGDYDLTMEGIYENFLHLSYHDPLMQKTGKCLDFLGGSDTLLQYIMRTQQMFLYVYQPFIAIAIHSEIAQVGKPNIEWPKATQRSRAMLMEKKEILKCWHNKISPQISRHLSIASFVTDVVSLLLHVLSPSTLRPVALHLLSQREREDLAQLVDTMVSYSLTYKNMKYEPLLTNQREAVSDASMLSLDPPIEHFISFKDYQTGYCVLSSTIKQVLLHEIEKRKILRENGGQPVHPSAESNSDQPLRTKDIGAFSNKTNNTNSSIKINRENPNCAPTHESLKAGASPNSILRDNKCGTANGVKVKAPTIANRRSSSSSFFDRFRKLSSKGSEIPDDYQQKPATMERDSRPFLFKYNEGFTNAVKRPVRIRELLP
ncbi:hypothetical protein QJS10_CPB18g01987 [Acorus calamus]|uniref:Uncharacterized protein n=1 Tax=Acorus calamus TaxID=4465 RepID=A0AAV9CME1_ACOCL|nr:hypothetical protein QJS10_CPB18g01987 [Acorus calamus]